MSDAAVPEVDVEALAAAVENGSPVLDVRTPGEWAQARIPGAVLIPLQELPERVDDVPEGEPLYVLCAVGARSLAAAKALNRAGFNAVSVAGGLEAWKASGRPVESD